MLGKLATRSSLSIIFLCVALCFAGIAAAWTLSSSVFPMTNFPRVVILVDNGIMPTDEMMARITRPIEEAMKDIPGAVTVKSATGRGSAEINVFFTWTVDMVQSELYVLGRLSQIRSTLPATADTRVQRLTFAAFPIIGVSLVSDTRDITELWETARYRIKPKFLQIPGVARVDLVGGRTPEYHIIVDPIRLTAAGLSLSDVALALEANNLVASAGLHEEDHTLYLTMVDGRIRSLRDIEHFVVSAPNGHPVQVRDFAVVRRAPEPVFNKVTADGHPAVLLNVRSQPDGSTLDIATALRAQVSELRRDLPPDTKLAFFYDQSEIVRASVASVWEAIVFGLLLSLLILYAFLRNWRTTLVATTVIPVTVLATLVAMRLMGLTFNLMTLGGIAAAIGLVIDDAIVVVESIHHRIMSGLGAVAAVEAGISDIIRPLIGSTLTPVVVFLPLALLDGLTGVFFRALALTMVVALLTSLVLAVTLIPALSANLLRERTTGDEPVHEETVGRLLQATIALYESALRPALRQPWAVMGICAAILGAGVFLYGRLDSEFLPVMDEGGFVIDYVTPAGTSLEETDRQLLAAEAIIQTIPEVDSYSRRTGARLALAIAEPNTGDFLVKLKRDRARSTDDVISALRQRFNTELPGAEWEFPKVLGDLIGDLMWAPKPIEVRLFSTDQEWLKKKAPEIAARVEKIAGVVDVFDGLVYTGPTVALHARAVDARRFGLSSDDIAATVNAAVLGRAASSVLEGDRIVDIRVKMDTARLATVEQIMNLPIRTSTGMLVKLSQVVDVVKEPGQLELRREDSRQDVAVTARTEGRDMGSAVAEIRQAIAADSTIPAGVVEFGGLYQQQQESFRNLLVVLLMAVGLVFTVLLFEFGSFAEPVAIVFGAVLALFGTVLALWLTGTSFNVVSFLGAIIGVGIVAKNGILMLDFVKHLRADGVDLAEALVRSGRRRLRPVLMTSLAAALGMLPLAWGIGSGADMLQPLAIAVIGALTISVVLSLIATPTMYFLLTKPRS
ncbi:MAG: efflux RND transporter permease subunit [Gemmatimonadaceae bacterium]|nr:efflux RND transporter permease subunit [Gemmatimonadaceae bacterium]